MNSLRELSRRADNLTVPDLDIDALVNRGEQQLRRRRLTAVLASAAAVILAIGLAVGGAALNRSADRGPADAPDTDPHQTDDNSHPPDESRAPVRKIVYSDVHRNGLNNRTIHFGDQVVETGNGFVHMDVTDDGFVYTLNGGAWFSDGGTPEQIGSHLCSAVHGEFTLSAYRGVMSANSGSLVAWFDCTEADRAALVVFDTASGREVVHRQIAFCGTGPALADSCELYGLTRGRVYVNRGSYAGSPRPDYRFDVRTQQLRPSSSQGYAEDVRTDPRGLVVGGSWQTGITTDGIGQSFRVVGSRLVPQLNYDSDWHLAKAAYDTATGRALQLRLPTGYRTDASGFDLFEWLDDETAALVSSGDLATGEILTCQLSDGRCNVAVQAPKGAEQPVEDPWRIVPNFGLPG